MLRLKSLFGRFVFIFGFFILFIIFAGGAFFSPTTADILDARNVFSSLALIFFFISMCILLNNYLSFRVFLKKYRHILKLIFADELSEKVKPVGVQELDILLQSIQRLHIKLASDNKKRLLQGEEREKLLEKARADAEQSNIAKTQFLANMSHEIRTPLNGITTVADLLHETELKEEQQELVNILKASGDNLLALINDLFDFSKIESGLVHPEYCAFNLYNTVESYVVQMSLKAREKDLELIFDIAPDVPENVVGDASKLKQILGNLIENAIKFTATGEIILFVNVKQSAEQFKEITFAVSDTGVGISPEIINTVFKSFTQGDNSRTRQYGGTGLGTTIAQSLVTLLGGSIWVESPNPLIVNLRDAQGTLFSFTLPMQALALSSNPTDQHTLDPLGINVLVVDDNKSSANVTARTIARFGFNTDTALSAKEALLIINSSAIDKYKIMFIDIRMPEINGFSLVRLLREEDKAKNTAIIMMKAVDSIIDPDTIEGLNIFSFISKPLQQSRIYDVLQKVMQTDISQEIILPEKKSPDDYNEFSEILIAEDNPINQQVALKVFQKLGYNPEIVENGVDVLKITAERKFKLIFMDIQMPIMNGLDATAKLRKRGDKTPIIAMTANAMKGDRELCLAAGMNDYIAKPIRSEIIDLKINRWLSTVPQEIVLDIADGIHLVGDKKTFLVLVDDFIIYAKSLYTEIEKAIKDDSHSELERICHTIKGSSGNLRMQQVSLVAKKLEDLARDHACSEYEAIYEELKYKVKKVIEFRNTLN